MDDLCAKPGEGHGGRDTPPLSLVHRWVSYSLVDWDQAFRPSILANKGAESKPTFMGSQGFVVVGFVVVQIKFQKHQISHGLSDGDECNYRFSRLRGRTVEA